MRSPRILAVSWGRMEVEGIGAGKDFKPYPGGGREWDWNATGTRHSPGMQPADAEELLAHGHDKGLRGDLPPPVLPGSGPGGRRPASPLPASQPFRRASGLPGQFVRSSSLSRLADMFRLHGPDKPA